VEEILFEKYKIATDNLNQYSVNLENFYKQFYVDRGQTSHIHDIVASLELNDHGRIKILFSGHRGSGKTTELHNIERMLSKNGEFIVFFVQSIQDGLDHHDIDYVDILVAIFTKILINIPKDLPIKNNLIEQLSSMLNKLGGEINRENKSMGQLNNLGNSFFSLLERRAQTKKGQNENNLDNSTLIGEIKHIFNDIITDLQKKTGKKILIIIDDLEKVTSPKIIESLFVDNYYLINKLECNFIFTIPISLKYSKRFENLRRAYTAEYTLPLFEVRKVNGEINMMEVEIMGNIIQKRVPAEIIDKKSLYFAAICSGGIVSDLLRLVSHSIIRATTQHSKITPQIVSNVFNEERTNTIRPLNEKDKKMIHEIHATKRPIQKIQEWIQLLYTSQVLEYTDHSTGKLWYDVHPFVSPDTKELESILSGISNF